ncbi:MAG: endolytic transglycosylase MltG [bacterium]|nr:endolytic transglycosylase MltG [bacterium]
MLRKYLFIIGAVLFVACLYISAPPFLFPAGSIVTVSDGAGLYVLSEKLEDDNVIRSPFWFRVASIVLGGERDMKAGQYYMSRPQNTFTIAWRVFHGDYDIETVKITIPEGFTVKKIAELFDKRFVFFDHENFVTYAPEGYLFPDTYFLPVTATASSTVRLLRNNFVRKIFPNMPEVESSGKSLEEIITMASIIENEAQSKEDREIISGILWKRLELGIPLQVDASFVYVNGKTTKDLTADDLKINSPYNTYLYRGLPPTPISNPGLESIEAALHPTTTPYLYFLTGDDGTMHYSRTFDEHVEKKLKYIR